MTDKDNNKLTRFGFAFPLGSPHVSRTMMLTELTRLIDYIGDTNAPKQRYATAIVEENCLAKRTEKNRAITKRFLLELYTLDNSKILFRGLLFFWQRDPAGRPLLALICAYARDTLLRTSASYILPLSEGAAVSRRSMEEFLDGQDPDRYSPGKLASNAKNLNSTWTQSGHLCGRSNKIRTRIIPSPGSVSYALLLGYLKGVRGSTLFNTDLMKLLDCSFDKAVELAEEASRKGWIVFKRVGDIIEVLFPNMINEQEMEWLREQS
ncbi:MAG: hypothetical protein VR64_03770 [Desulfatitalea sp. BRH_c12]|nr:MAG: hypothetical protein VR64_03770 [Desulfatitalea sp. BRH_c12]